MTVVVASGLTVGNGPGGNDAGGNGAGRDHGMQVFGGGHSIEVVSGSLKLAAGEMRAYQPDWGRLSRACSDVPEGNGLQGDEYLEIFRALQQVREAARKASEQMMHSSASVDKLEQSLSRAAENYEQAESQNLSTIGYADTDASVGAVLNMMQAMPEWREEMALLAFAIYSPGLLGMKLRNEMNAAELKKVGARTVRTLFSVLFDFAPNIVVAGKEEVSTMRTDATKLTTWIEHQQLAGEGHGSIMVSKAVTSSGEHRWIVTIPGTNMSGGSTWGLRRMAQAFDNNTDDVRNAVEAALKEAGAMPGDGVYLNGHSQGGTHSLNLAHDQEFKEQYKLKGTFTAGAPHGDDDPPTDAPQLMLIDPDDAIPALGATAPLKVSPNRVAVFSKSRDRVASSKPDLLGSDHGSHNYLDHARVADGVQDTALSDLKKQMELDDLKITETYRFKTSNGSKVRLPPIIPPPTVLRPLRIRF